MTSFLVRMALENCRLTLPYCADEIGEVCNVQIRPEQNLLFPHRATHSPDMRGICLIWQSSRTKLCA